MKKLRPKVAGVSLIEMLLVVAIAATILILSIKQYQAFKLDSDFSELQTNVDTLFKAANYFYQANCKRVIDPTTGPVANTGLLDPTSDGTGTPTPSDPYPVTIAALTAGGYLSTPMISVPLIDSNTYMVQFNQQPVVDRMVQTANGPVSAGKIIVWTIQVSALIYDNTKRNTWLTRSNATCLSRKTGSVVTPCSLIPVPPGGGSIYLVWERPVTSVASGTDSGLWQTNIRGKQFNQQYEVHPTNYLTNQTTPQQNYLCGS